MNTVLYIIGLVYFERPVYKLGEVILNTEL